MSGNDALHGGGVYNLEYASIDVASSVFEENTADYGGAIYNLGDIELLDSSLLNNSARRGGGIYTESGWVRFAKGLIYGNQATIGAAIFDAPPQEFVEPVNAQSPEDVVPIGLEIETSTISSNRALDFAGALYNSSVATIFKGICRSAKSKSP